MHRLAVGHVDRPAAARTAPDGSNFQLQHWTHTFDYALVSGDGDWRGGDPGPQRGVLAPAARGRRKAQRCRRVAGWGSLLEIEPAGTVQLGALKAAGNPLARGSAGPSTRPTAVAVRLVETSGADRRCRDHVRAAPGVVGVARRPARAAAPAAASRIRGSSTLHGYEIATVLTRLNMPQRARRRPRRSWRPTPRRRSRCTRGTGCTTAAPRRSAGCPRSRTCTRRPVVAEPDDASGAAAYRGQRLHRLGAARHGAAGVSRRLDGRARRAAVRAAAGRAPGGRHRGDDAAGRAAGALSGARRSSPSPATTRSPCPRRGARSSRTSRTVSVGTPRGAQRTAVLVGEPEPTSTSPPASAARLAVTVGTDARRDLVARGAPDQPVGNLGVDRARRASGAVLPPAGRSELEFDVAPPPWVEPGEWWALVRVGCAGRLLYSPAVKVTVR